MTRHIETRSKLKKIALVEDFESLLERCTLADQDKKILRMHYLEHKELLLIADELGYSEKTVKRRHKAALDKISDALLSAGHSEKASRP